MNEEMMFKLRDVAENADVDVAMHAITSEILHRLSVILSSADLVAVSIQSENEQVKLGTSLIQRSSEEVRFLVDDVLTKVFFPRLQKER